ncbi:MAG: hypothetical protein GX826_03830 [Gammaproteobacteria bacterium]|nr:hypothetical protein [Gammaproteobacteria bacterium]
MNTTLRLRRDSVPSARLLSLRQCPATLFLLILMVLLAGCSRDPAPATAPAINADAAPAASDAFVLLEASGGDWQGRPALQLRFSQPLIAGQAFDERILVRDANGADVEGSWVLDGDDAGVLRFPYVQGDTTYRISFNGGLGTPDGRMLEGLPEQEVYSGNLSPTVGFASRGSVLPARGTQGLPLVAVNTPEVDVEFFRVREKSLSDFLARYAANDSRGYWELGRSNRWPIRSTSTASR